MNHRGGWALIKSTWASWMQYRSFFFVLAFGWMIPPLASLFAWSAAAGDGQIMAMNRETFTLYYLVLVLVNQFTYAQSNWTVGDVIREGSLDAWLLRPLSPIYQVLSSEAAGKTVMMCFAVPAVLLISLILRPQFSDIAPSQIVFFMISLAFAWALRFLWGLWLALLAFWSSRSDALLAVQDAMVFLLSGVAAPLALLPGVLQTAARILPFRYMVGFPVEFLVQPFNFYETVTGFACQLIWLVAAFLLMLVFWQRGLRRYTSARG